MSFAKVALNEPVGNVSLGHEEFFQEGEQKGVLKGIMQTARNLKQMGLSTEQIMKATALTADEIAKL